MKLLHPTLFSLFLVIGLCAFPLPALAQTPVKMSLQETLKLLQWQKRVVLVCATSAEQINFQKQKILLQQDTLGQQERDMKVISLLFNEMEQADKDFLKKDLNIPAHGFTLLLLGKDGIAKLKRSTPVTTQVLFYTVDAMRMRRQEMRRNN
ncbi:MAG: DUF4174 domain-containing protein [Bacteroidota bacterium]